MSTLCAELQHLRWRLEQTEQARNEATEALRECRQELECTKSELKDTVNEILEARFNRFAEGELWKSYANALASELEAEREERKSFERHIYLQKAQEGGEDS